MCIGNSAFGSAKELVYGRAASVGRQRRARIDSVLGEARCRFFGVSMVPAIGQRLHYRLKAFSIQSGADGASVSCLSRILAGEHSQCRYHTREEESTRGRFQSHDSSTCSLDIGNCELSYNAFRS